MKFKENAKNKINKKAKKFVFKIIKPFLPFIIIIVGLFLAICTIVDAIFVQEVQSDNSSMSETEIEIKNQCISKAEYLNICNNFIGSEPTNYLLDVDDRERDKCIEWSHLYSIMAFYNMTYNTKIDNVLLEKVANEFKSTFIYEQYNTKIEEKKTDENEMKL